MINKCYSSWIEWFNVILLHMWYLGLLRKWLSLIIIKKKKNTTNKDYYNFIIRVKKQKIVKSIYRR